MQTKQLKQNLNVRRSLHSPRRFFAALGAAAALASFGLTTGALAQQPGSASDQPGNNAPHEERNSAQHPELFASPVAVHAAAPSAMVGSDAPHEERNSADAALFRTPASADQPVVTESRRHAKHHRVLVAAITVETSVSERSGGAATGTDAPHEERNSAQHPELWTR